MRKPLAFLLSLGVLLFSFAGPLTDISALPSASGASSPADSSWAPAQEPECKAVLVVNADTGTVVYAKNAQTKVYPASLTKMMTAVLAVEKYGKSLNTPVTITKDDLDPLKNTGSITLAMKAGETFTVGQLLYCLLLPSANSAAMALARATGGSVDKFVQMMNAKAKALGMDHTHYANPHGLQDPDHYTTAQDTYTLAKYAMTVPLIRQIVDTKSYSIPATNLHAARPLVNTNSLLNQYSGYYYKYCKGIKTGTTSEAGFCLVSCATKDSYTYYCVAMGGPKKTDADPNRAFIDTKNLYVWAFSHFSLTTLLDKAEPLSLSVPVNYAWNQNQVVLYPGQSFTALMPINADLKQVKLVPHLPASVNAPVKIGQKIGTAEVYYQGKHMGSIALISNQSVARSNSLFALYLITKFFNSVWFKVVVVALIALFIAYLVITVRINRRRKMLNKRGVKKYKIR